MRQKLLFLLPALAFLLPARLSAFYYEYGGVTLEYAVTDEDTKTCMVSGHNDFSGALVIPDVANDGTTDYSVTSIGRDAFSHYHALTSVVIPNSITSIGGSAFYDCSGLTSVEIPNSVTSIGGSAFYGCSGLTSVEIPNSVTSIGGSAFYHCNGLKKAEFSSIESLCNIAFSDNNSNPLNYAHCLYIDGKEVTEAVIPETVTSIGWFAFTGGSGLTSVEIPNSVTSIGRYAFWNCSGLTSVEIPNSVTEIGSNAFHGCRGLTSVEIPNSVTSIGGFAFAGCSGLTSVDIPNSVTEIGVGAFEGCSGLNTVVIPNSVTEIRNGAFSGCGLTSIVIPNSVTSIGGFAFSYCSDLTSVELPNSVTSIGESAFSECYALTSVEIPNSVTSIGRAAFMSCRGLDTIIIGYGVETIDGSAFYHCPASNIYITAQTPPKTEYDPFSNYTGILHLQGKTAVEAYKEHEYWGKFNSELMIEPTSVEIEGMTSISGNPGDTFRLKATMTPADVTLPYIFWRSTNPEIATVDNNGLVTLQVSTAEKQTRAEAEDSDGTCRIIAESLYFNGPVAEITVNNTGIDGVETVMDRNDNTIDYTLPYDVYNMNGLRVSDTTDGLSVGIYIIRQGKAAVKTVVKQ